MLLKIRTLPTTISLNTKSLLDTSEEENNQNNNNNNNIDSDDTSYIQYLVAVVSKDLILTWNTFDGSGRKDNNNNNNNNNINNKCDDDHPSVSQQALTYLMPQSQPQQQQQQQQQQNEKDSYNNDDDNYEEEDYDSPIQDGSTSAAFLAWLEFHIGRTLRTMMIVRSMGVKLVKRMDNDPSQVELTDIMDFKNDVSKVLAVAEEQSLCMNMIKKLHKDNNNNKGDNINEQHSGLDFTNLVGQLSILISTSDSTERMGLRLEKRSNELRQQYDSYQQDLINHRLKVLTVISAIFMPLTFMAGWYGMNFSNMPELEYENSYYIFLGTILAIASGLLYFFYSHGWFS